MGVSAEERMCLALRYFATSANYSLVGDFQGVSKSTVSKSVHEVLDFFDLVIDDYIAFPATRQEMQDSSSLFFEKFGGKPLVVGCIDGTHIPILAPRNNEVDFVNRKAFHSLNVMIICGADRRIFCVDSTYPGAVHDSYVLQTNDLWHASVRGYLGEFWKHYFLCYPMTKFLFTPIAHPTNDIEERFNAWHMSTRVIVEQTIAVLKQRFRCLDRHGGYLYHSPLDCSRIVNVCTALHNLCIGGGVPLPLVDDDDLGPVPRPQRVPVADPGAPAPVAGMALREGRARRALYMRNQFV